MITTWFVLIAGLWTGYFILEGFDFGVGVLLPVLGRDERERQVLLTTIGPVWDGNEVWVITAAGATFAAFPDWYAGLFSAFYLPLLAILVALILRGLALEYRGKRPDPPWRRRWDRAIVAGSLVPALGWGLVFADLAHGLPLSTGHEYRAGPLGLLTLAGILGGLALLGLCATHGALFLALKTTGAPRVRAAALAARVGWPTTGLTVALLVALVDARSGRAAVATVVLAVLVVVVALALTGALLANRAGREGWAFAGTALGIAATVATVFAALYPEVLPATNLPVGLTVSGAAASPYALKIMSWAAALFAPLVLLYQGWTYWVFRRRVTVEPAAVS